MATKPKAGQLDKTALLSGSDRQLLVNPNFTVWQQGTSISSANLGSAGNRNGYTADQWWVQAYRGGSGSGDYTFTASRQTFTPGQTEVPNNSKYFYRFDLTGLATVGGTDAIIRIQQKMEGVQLLSNGKAIWIGYLKASVARTIYPVLEQNFGAGGSSLAIAVGSAMNVTTSWQKFKVIFDVPSISGKTVGTDDFLGLTFVVYKSGNGVYSLPSGAVGSHVTGSIDIADNVLGFGDQEIPFCPRPQAEEDRLCRYYFERIGSVGSPIDELFGVGHFQSNTLHYAIVNYQPKRKVPTITMAAASQFRILVPGGALTTSAMSTTGVNVDRCLGGSTVSSTTNVVGTLQRADGALPYIDISARL